jgi:environmental stress-induced protein Ves
MSSFLLSEKMLSWPSALNRTKQSEFSLTEVFWVKIIDRKSMKAKKVQSAVLIQESSYRTIPWKNGLGATSEIAIFPPESSIADNNFIWRLSTAEMNESGVFSSFPKHERILVLIEGAGIKLIFDSSELGPEVLLSKHQIHSFPGASVPKYELLQGKVRDFNLIYHPEEVRPYLKVVQIEDKPRSFKMEGDIAFLFGLSGKVAVSLYPGEEKFELSYAETLLVNPSKNLDGDERLILLESTEKMSSLILIEIFYSKEKPFIKSN